MDDTIAGLTGAIYDCLLLPDQWSGVLLRIQNLLGAQSSYLIRHGIKPSAPDMTVLVEHDVDQAMRRLYDEHYSRLNPLLPYLGSVEGGEVYCTRHLVTRKEYLRSRFYQEWAMPQGWFDYAGVTLIRQPDASAAIGFTRSSTGRVFDDHALLLLRRLAPHLRRTAQIQNLTIAAPVELGSQQAI